MKKLTLTAMAALALVLTFTQCKKETGTPAADEGIFVTLNATYGQSGEKTDFTPGDGSFVWSSGVEEYIFVGGSLHGDYFGVLHGTGGGSTSMSFSGYLTDMPEEGETLHFFYLGKGTTDQNISTTLDFSNQDGTLENLTNNHVAIGHTTFNGSFNFDVTFSMMVSFAYFNTSAFVNSSSNAETVYLQGDEVYSSATVNFQDGTITGNANESINIGQAASGVYVALIPSTTSETTTLNFRSFSKTASMTFLSGIQAGKYYSKKNGNALDVEANSATTNTVNLASLTSDYEAESGDILTGTLSGNHKISIANNAIVMLSDVDITCLTDGSEYAGITCSGNANIILDGTNNVVGGVFLKVRNAEYYHYGQYPGIYIPSGYTLTIDGNGTLNASSAYANASREDNYECYAAGIGGGRQQNCGNIVINGGTIVAKGGGKYGSAGIGGGTTASCGDITITGGNVTATGGKGAAGIGSGSGAWTNTGSIISSSCGDILISGGTVTATGGNGDWGAGAGIGSGQGYGNDRISTCGDITIKSTVTQVTAKRGRASQSAGDNAHSIGAGGSGYSTCGTVTIENGANVIQN